MRFRLYWWRTKSENKFDAEERLEYLGDKESIWGLWFVLYKEQGWPHVEVFNLAGMKCNPMAGLNGMVDYN